MAAVCMVQVPDRSCLISVIKGIKSLRVVIQYVINKFKFVSTCECYMNILCPVLFIVFFFPFPHCRYTTKV